MQGKDASTTVQLPHDVAAAALAAVKGQQKLQSQVEQVSSRDHLAVGAS
jgi:hypothetical protein